MLLALDKEPVYENKIFQIQNLHSIDGGIFIGKFLMIPQSSGYSLNLEWNSTVMPVLRLLD